MNKKEQEQQALNLMRGLAEDAGALVKEGKGVARKCARFDFLLLTAGTELRKLSALEWQVSAPPGTPATSPDLLLMAHPENPTGWKLEDLLEKIVRELHAKSGKLAGNEQAAAMNYQMTNAAIIQSLKECGAMQLAAVEFAQENPLAIENEVTA